jgi:translocation and assembly module TamB
MRLQMRDATQNSPTPGRIGVLLLGLLLALSAVVGAGLWWLGTQSALDFALRKAQGIVADGGGELRIEDARGGLYRGIDMKALELRSGTLRVQARDVIAHWSLSSLLQRHIGIAQFGARSLHIGLPEAAEEPEPKRPTPMPPSFALPLTFDLQRFAIDELHLTPARRSGEAEDIVLRNLRGALAYRGGSYTLSGLGVASEYGAIEAGHIVLGAEPPHALDAALRLAGEIEARAYTLNAKAKGDLERLRADASATVAGAAVDADATLAPLAVMPLSSVRASWQRLDLRALLPSLPTTRIEGKLRLAPDSAAAAAPPSPGGAVTAWRGEIALDNAEPGAIDAQRLPVQRFSTRVRITDAADATRLRVGLEEIALALGDGAEVNGSLEVMPGRTRPIAGANVPQTVAALQFRRIDAARIATTLPRTALDGTLALTQQAFDLDLAQDARATRTLLPNALAAASGAATIRANGTIDERAVRLEMARVQLGESRLQMAGSAGTIAPYRIDLQGSAANIQPRQWLAQAANDPRLRDAKLNGDWSVRGDVAPGEHGGAARVNALAKLSLANSRLAGRPLEARIGTRLIAGQGGGARIEQTQADARLGANRVRLDGALGRASDRMRIDLDVEEPQAIEPRLRGSIDVAGTLSGAFHALRTDLELRAQRLVFKQPDGDVRVGSIKLAARAPAAVKISGDAPLDLDLAVDDVHVSDKHLASLRVVTDGTVGVHRFRIAAAREGQSLQVAGRGSATLANEPSWRATLEKAAVDGKVPVTLRTPATLAIGTSAAQVRDLALAVADGNLVVKGLDVRWTGQRGFSSQGELRDLPVVRLMELSGTDASADALRGLRLDGDWSLGGSTAEDLSGQVAIALREEAVRGTVPIGVGTGARGAARNGVNTVGNGMRVRLDRGRLDGRIDLKLPSLAFTHALTAPDLVLDGRVAIDGTIGGTTRDPRIDALLSGENLQLLRRSVGWRLADGELKARLSGRAVELQTLRMRSGEGSVTVSGKAALRDAAAGASGAPGAKNGSTATGTVPFDGRFTMNADRFLVPIGPGQRVLVSGNSELASNPRGLALTGKLAVDQGIIEVQGSSAPALPTDVVLEGARDHAARAGAKKKDEKSAIRIAADLSVALGDKLRVTGRGVDAHLGGELRIGGTLPDDPQVTGPVRIVNGSYQAYGQNLRIERGDVRFNGPLDNPALDIVAKRPFLPVEVGLSISGTAKTPAIQLVSKPEMPQTDQLSWLVLGVSPDKSRSAAQSLALRQAATQLLGGEDGPRKPGVAERLGLDVFNFGYGSDTKFEEGVTEAASPTKLPGASRSASGSGAEAPTDVVTIGKRFSDRLFISYEQGLRGVSNLLTAQYLLTERLSLRAQSGTASALDLLYSFAFD